MQNTSQDPPASFKAQNQDLKDMDALCTFRFKIESKTSEHGCTKDQWPYPNQDKDGKPKLGTSSYKNIGYIQIKIKMPNPSHKPPESSENPNQDLKDIVLFTFKFKIESQNLKQWCTNDQWLYSNQDKDARLQPETSNILWSPKIRLKGHTYSLQLF